MLSIFAYDFMQRALLSGLLIGIICPLIGIFLILRRQSLIGDGLGHIAFAGVTAGWFMGIYPVYSATVLTVAAALGIEELRARRPAFADMILAIFFYTGMAAAILLSSLIKSSNVNLMSYLFGSIVTVTGQDLAVIACLTLSVIGILLFVYKELVFLTFDEEVARVSGLPVKKINMVLAVLTALTVAVAMRIVGVLLVSALMVIPVAASLQISRSFRSTIFYAVIISEVSVTGGLVASFFLKVASGGTIVLIAVAIFVSAFVWRQLQASHPARYTLSSKVRN
ncbi:metal ABC transporter permease [Sporomusa aerivorans]|uniref:metal ABC transporter permease n=1 Tax=Sporomusa aerivorans TaxID=204936 RepID=UPI00352B31F8